MPSREWFPKSVAKCRLIKRHSHDRSTHLQVTALRTPLGGLALVLLINCTGQVKGGGAAADGPTSTGLTPGAGGSGGAITPAGDVPLDCSKPHVAFSALRRLTREQYDNAIRDLLGIEGHPSLGLAADEKLAAFFSK